MPKSAEPINEPPIETPRLEDPSDDERPSGSSDNQNFGVDSIKPFSE